MPIISIFLIFIAKILPFKIPFQFVEFHAHPVICDTGAFIIILCYSWWCKKI